MATYEPLMPDADFARLIGTTPFGRGTARHAFDVLSDPDVIVKKAACDFPGSNMLEWFIWCSARQIGGRLQQVLGECIAISESGQYLMMERLDDLISDDYANVPDVPVWFNDPKPDAFGKRHGSIKIRDYGLVKMDELVVQHMSFPPAFAMAARGR